MLKPKSSGPCERCDRPALPGRRFCFSHQMTVMVEAEESGELTKVTPPPLFTDSKGKIHIPMRHKGK